MYACRCVATVMPAFVFIIPLSFNSFSWKWLIVVVLPEPATYCSRLSLLRGSTSGSYSTAPLAPPNVMQRAMPIAPIASSLPSGSAVSWDQCGVSHGSRQRCHGGGSCVQRVGRTCLHPARWLPPWSAASVAHHHCLLRAHCGSSPPQLRPPHAV